MTTELGTGPCRVPGFELLERIGAGGMGEVFLARQLALGRVVALKFLRVAAGVEPGTQVARFRREAELMAKVSHPNVVTVFDFGLSDGVPYLAMEYVSGGDLRSRMVARSPMPSAQALALIRPVTSALSCLHCHGILHRDLKPENILISRDEIPKVADFGIAVVDTSIGTMTATGQVLGSVGYVAPEQQYRLPLDERADQYSMAAIFYELLTGQKALGAVAPPSRLNHALGSAVDATLLRGLSEEREDRFATIGEFGEALALAMEGPSKSSRRRRRARPVGAATAVAAILLGTLALVPWGDGGSRGPGAEDLSNSHPPKVEGKPEASPPPRSFINTLHMEMIRIDPGEFLMGSPPSEDADGAPDEQPQHRVRITRPFYLSSWEVTVSQFRACIESNKCPTEPELNGKGGTVFDPTTRTLKDDPALNWEHPGLPHPQGPDEPVVQVTWNDARGFCKWLSSREGREYRLPTEAEWEYACRAGTTTRWSMGDDPEHLDGYAWTSRNAGLVTHPVGLKRANPFGLYDMHGNVWEWCLDYAGPYTSQARDDPKGPPDGERRVIRGGGWDQGKTDRTRSASRLFYPPSSAYYAIGFRICSPIPPGR